MQNRISAVIPVYHGEKTIKETFESIKGIVDEIIVVHDGPCSDNTLKIARKFTKKVYSLPKRKGRSVFPFAFGLRKAKYEWVLKLDDYESLSDELRKNIRKLIQNNEIDAYSFIHPLWDGKKSVTKTWPRKVALARKSKISYLGFPGFDMTLNVSSGKVKKTNYIIIHKPKENQDVGFKGFREKVMKRYAPSQAKNLLKDFKEFPTFQYDKKNFPLKIKIRTKLPVINNTIYALLVFFKQMFYEGAWKEGNKGFNVVAKTFIYNIYLGYLIHKEKIKQKKYS